MAAEPVPMPPMEHVGAAVELPDDPARAFDFWLGEWRVINKHLRGDGRWEDGGEAIARIDSVADGGAVLERWSGRAHGDRLIGFSLRTWDPQLEKWVIYLNWHRGRPSGFSLMHGERNGERIELFPPGDKTEMRYSFSEPHVGSALWDSARSSDGGATWVTEWVMQFTRTDAPRQVDASSTVVERPPESASRFERTRDLDALLGVWRGKGHRATADGSWEEGTVEARTTSMIEGFGLLQFLDTSWGEKTLTAIGFDTGAEAWIGIRADNRRPGLQPLQGEIEAGSVIWTNGASGADLRESWEWASESRAHWQRQARDGDGWKTVLSADLSHIR